MGAKTIKLEDWLAERMQDPEFREAYEALEPVYQLTRLRILRGLTQKQLAELVGTKQPSIARLESGATEPRISSLRRIAKALGARLEIRLVPKEELPSGGLEAGAPLQYAELAEPHLVRDAETPQVEFLEDSLDAAEVRSCIDAGEESVSDWNEVEAELGASPTEDVPG